MFDRPVDHLLLLLALYVAGTLSNSTLKGMEHYAVY